METKIDENTGREIIQEITYKQDKESIDGAFVAISKATDDLRKNGYIIGSMCMDMPMGFAKADKVNYIAKWRNIPRDEYCKLDGIIIPIKPDNEDRDRFRDSWVKVLYFKDA